VPHLAAQPPLSIFYQLLQFRDQRRLGGGMEAIAAQLSEQDMRDLAAHFARLPAPKGQPLTQPSLASQGEQLAQAQFCSSCHGQHLQGQKHVPRLAGQRADYFLTQLQHLHSGERADMDGTMASAAKALSPEEMAALSAYAQSLD
jgi:cytochrome c553